MAGGARPGSGRPAYNSNNYINASFRKALHQACINDGGGGEDGLLRFFEKSLRERPECVFPLIAKCMNDTTSPAELLKSAGSLRVNFYIDYMRNGIANGHQATGPTISAKILPPSGDDAESSGD